MKATSWILPLLMLAACEPGTPPADAYGNFEARELLLSAERSGKIVQWNVQQGDWVEADELIAVIDTVGLHLQKNQLLAQIEAVLSRTQDMGPQLAVYDSQLANITREQQRLQALVADSAAPSQKLDDLNGQLQVIRQQKTAHLTQLQTANRSVSREVEPLRVQVNMLDDQLRRSYLRAPEAGRVLVTYAENGEVTAAGKPLLKLADTRSMELRVYLSGSQLGEISVGQLVTVLFDGKEGGLDELPGTLAWVADEAEFTPKSIQTREERVDLVYEAKVAVSNPEGRLKIGMPGEIQFRQP